MAHETGLRLPWHMQTLFYCIGLTLIECMHFILTWFDIKIQFQNMHLYLPLRNITYVWTLLLTIKLCILFSVFCFKTRDFSTERIMKLVRVWYSVEYRNDSSIFNHLKSKKVQKNIRPLTNSSKGLAKIKLRSSVRPI